MIKARCIVCFEIYREEDDQKQEICFTDGLCDGCLEKVRTENKKKREAERK